LYLPCHRHRDRQTPTATSTPAAIGWNTWHQYWRDADSLYVPGEEARRRARAYIEHLSWQWMPTIVIGRDVP
jgi:hypothetical protein